VSWIVPWNGKEYDVDPTDFDGLELSMIKRVAGYTYKELISAIADLDSDAIRAIFWTVDRRTNPDLTFGDYAGPSMKVVVPTISAFNDSMADLGKAMTSGTNGSPSSQNTSDGPEPNISL